MYASVSLLFKQVVKNNVGQIVKTQYKQIFISVVTAHEDTWWHGRNILASMVSHISIDIYLSVR